MGLVAVGRLVQNHCSEFRGGRAAPELRDQGRGSSEQVLKAGFAERQEGDVPRVELGSSALRSRTC